MKKNEKKFFLFFICFSAQASRIDLTYDLNFEYEFNDNIRLRDDDISISGYKIEVPSSLKYSTERFTSTVNLKASAERYNNDAYNNNNYEVNPQLIYSFGRTILNFDIVVEQDTTRDSEFLDTGIIDLIARRRNLQSGFFSADYRLSELSSIQVNFQRKELEYEEGFRQNYNLTDMSTGYYRRVSETTNLNFILAKQIYDNELNDNSDKDNISIKLNLKKEITENKYFKFDYGILKSEGRNLSTFDSENEYNDYEYIYGASFKSTKPNLLLSYRKFVQPSTIGLMTLNSQIRISYSYCGNCLTQISTNFVVGNNRALSNDEFNERDFYSGQLRINRKFAPELDVAIEYTYKKQMFIDPQLIGGESNTIKIKFNYKPQL